MKRKLKHIRIQNVVPMPMAQEAQEDLNATSAALYLDPLEEDGLEVSVRDAESVEDPLNDWAGSDDDAEEWLKEHHCRGEEQLGME